MVELLVDGNLEIPVVLGRRDQLIRGHVVLMNIRGKIAKEQSR